MAAGGTGLAVSATATLATGGTATPVTLPGATASAGLIAKGTVELAAGKLLMANGGDNFKNQKGRAKERSGNSKNEKHGDSGRAQSKAEKQLSELRERAQNATGTEKKKLQQKIKNIQETAKQKAKGEEHSRANKR